MLSIAEEVAVSLWTPDSGVPRPTGRPDQPAPQPSIPTNTDGDAAAVEAGAIPQTAGDDQTDDSLADEAPGLAVNLTSAPQPKLRPKSIAGKIDQAVARILRPDASGGRPATRSVRTAATESGLPLDRTSLIGIINVNSGREALVRLPNGRFRRVGRGDLLDGWRVSGIGRDDLRLSRSGKNHTLLLVGR